MTICLRKDALINIEHQKYKTFSDIALILEISKNGGKMAKLPINTAVYRYLGQGVNSGNLNHKNVLLSYQTKYEFLNGLNNKKFVKKLRIYYLKGLLNEMKSAIKLRKVDLKISFYSIKYFLKTLKY